MNKVVKVCKKHGDLTEEQIRWDLNRGIRYMRCRACRFESHRKQYTERYAEKIAYISQWKKENRQKINKQAQDLRKLNPEKGKEIYQKWLNNLTKEEKEKHEILQMSYRFKASVEEIEHFIKESNGLCAICGNPEKRIWHKTGETMKLCIDHCHKSNVIRGMLCHSCNSGIGKFNEDTDLMMKAIEYLIGHSYLKEED